MRWRDRSNIDQIWDHMGESSRRWIVGSAATQMGTMSDNAVLGPCVVYQSPRIFRWIVLVGGSSRSKLEVRWSTAVRRNKSRVSL